MIPEIDIPGHAYSWKVGKPSLVSSCFPNMSSNINDFPLNVALSETYETVALVIQDLASLFQDDLHLGGDEVISRCWLSDPSIVAWMKQNHFDTTDALQYFHSKVESMIPENRTVIYWQEVASFNISSPLAVFQIWKDSQTLETVVGSNRSALASFGWYFVASPLPTWKSFYLNDPCTNLSNVECSFVRGGEACAWGETINDFNIQQMIWPLGLAAAERLWSDASVNSTITALPRLSAKICQLNARGIPAGPAAPSKPCE